MKTILIAISVAAVTAPASSRARPIPDGNSRPITASVMRSIHNSSMPAFLSYRRMRYGAPTLDWSSDGCSQVPDTGPAFDFTNPCRRHDFGYRNYKKFRIFTEANRKLIDAKFLADMRAHCATRSAFLRPSCYATAQTYDLGVRQLGG